MIGVHTGTKHLLMLASNNLMYRIVLSLTLLFMAAVGAQAKEWRGIVPLRSTRVDVERLLGPPAIKREYSMHYEINSEQIFIDLSRGPCTVEFSRWNVPRDTVISIWITLRSNQLSAASLNLNQKKYTKYRENHRPQIVRYVNQTEGIEYSVDEETGNVGIIKYVPSAADKSLACPETKNLLYEQVRFAKYSNISLAAEKKILDRFADQLIRYSSKSYASSEAHILAYDGHQSPSGEALTRAQRAKEYLVNVRHIDANRIEIRDACCRQTLNIELYLVPPGATPPRLAP